MTCTECGATMKTKRENYKYDASGLPVVLMGVSVSRCPECGEEEVEIPNIEGLHREIALTIVPKKERLAGQEIRFLRKHLGWSSASLATHLGVTPETMSRWETGAIPMGVTADRLLRLIVAYRDRPVSFPLKMLRVVGWGDASPARIRVDIKHGRWRAYAA